MVEFIEEDCKIYGTHMQEAFDLNKAKIISSMNMIYFLSLDNMSLLSTSIAMKGIFDECGLKSKLQGFVVFIFHVVVLKCTKFGWLTLPMWTMLKVIFT